MLWWFWASREFSYCSLQRENLSIVVHTEQGSLGSNEIYHSRFQSKNHKDYMHQQKLHNSKLWRYGLFMNVQIDNKPKKWLKQRLWPFKKPFYIFLNKNDSFGHKIWLWPDQTPPNRSTSIVIKDSQKCRKTTLQWLIHD